MGDNNITTLEPSLSDGRLEQRPMLQWWNSGRVEQHWSNWMFADSVYLASCG
jgi:hypothetical protein